jgi:hypothetical protein
MLADLALVSVFFPPLSHIVFYRSAIRLFLSFSGRHCDYLAHANIICFPLPTTTRDLFTLA